jgi:hypothetical protein
MLGANTSDRPRKNKNFLIATFYSPIHQDSTAAAVNKKIQCGILKLLSRSSGNSVVASVRNRLIVSAPIKMMNAIAPPDDFYFPHLVIDAKFILSSINEFAMKQETC